MGRKAHIIYMLFCTLGSLVQAQERGHFLSEIGAVTSFQNTPFFLRTNHYGLIPDNSSILYLNGKYYKSYDSTGKTWGLGYGLETQINMLDLAKESQILIPEAYLKARYKHFELYVGRRKEIVGLVDTLLSSGSYIWSGNSLPMPKIQIGVPEYTPLFKSDLISIKGAFSHGWFDNRGKVKSIKLHQKWFYLRIGNPQSKLKVYGGFNHQVQWGGYNAETGQRFADNIYGYFYAVFPLKKVGKAANGSLTTGDLQNRVGNQLGTIDFSIERSFPKFNVTVYRQNLYEQGGALLRLANIQDGLNGVSLEIKDQHSSDFRISKVVTEFFYSKNQGKTPLIFTNTVQWELENYFTHFQYIDGWTYQEQIIGTPFFTTRNNTDANFSSGNQLVNNNRVKAFYFAFASQYKTNNFFETKIAISENNGILVNHSPSVSANYNQLSLGLSWHRIINLKNSLRAEVGYDVGKLYPKSIGFNLVLNRHIL